MKLLVALTTCRKFVYAAGDSVGHKNSQSNIRIQAVFDTWYKEWAAKYADKFDVKVFVGSGDQEVQFPNLVELPAPDSYYELPAKVKAMFEWAIARDYDWCLKIDDDVLLRPEKFIDFFQAPFDYAGYELESDTLKWASGAAYVVSKRAMQLVVDTPWDPTWNSAEDQATGRILAKHGIPLTHDPRYLCCSCDACFKKYGLENLITIHTTKPEMMYDLHAKLG